MSIDISGLDKAKVLAALHNGTRPLGMGALQAIAGDLSEDDARELLEKGDDAARMFGRKGSLRFDYLLGRPLKVDISGDSFDERLYDRDAGHGAAARAIESIRK